jgi:hypothetical protein
MSSPKKLKREKLEVYLVNLLMAYRPLMLLSGFTLLIFGLVAISISLPASLITMGLALSLFMLAYSYQALLFFAKLCANIGTIWYQDD